MKLILNESEELSKGIFWIIDLDNINNNKKYCFNIPCDFNGTPDNYSGLNSKSGSNYNHKLVWDELPKQLTNKKSFDYYPRGRVEIANNKAIVYLSQYINTNEIQKFIIDQFGLKNIEVKFHSDNSDHYKCYLDERYFRNTHY